MDVQFLHTIFIALHAASAVISFFVGCFLIFSLRNTAIQRWFGLYWWALIALVIFLAAAILVNWAEYSTIERIIFPALFVLALYMLYRARGANRSLETKQKGWQPDAIKDIGFTLISLFEGFIIVGGIDVGFPGWLIAVAAILGFLLGNWLMGFAQ